MSGKLLPRLEFEFFCAKCSNRYVVVTTQSMIDRGKYRKHCSLKCANGHIHSESWKANVSERLKGRSYPERQNPVFELTCRCGKKFSSKNHKSLYCSRSCTSIYGRDFSHINKQAYVNGKIQAGGTTKWFTYNDIRVQGTYELRACHILDRMKERQEITGWEYTNDRVPYRHSDGSEHQYLIDFKIFRLDGTFFYVEVKGRQQLNDILKWNAARAAGHELIVWFKADLERLECTYSTAASAPHCR